MAQSWYPASVLHVAFSDANRPIQNTNLLRHALEYCLMFDKPILSHPEDRSLTQSGVMHEGLTSMVLGLPAMAAKSEDVITSRDLRLAEATGGRLHLMNISSSGSVELINRAKLHGLAVTAEICPANFTLTDESLRSFDSNCKVNPPLRSRDHVDACIAGLVDGTLDIISSGHAPRAAEKKMQELDLAPFGMVGLETTLALVISMGIAWLSFHLFEKHLLKLKSRFGFITAKEEEKVDVSANVEEKVMV